MRMKKVFPLLLAGAMTASLAGGCTNTRQVSEKSDSSAGSSSTSDEKADGSQSESDSEETPESEDSADTGSAPRLDQSEDKEAAFVSDTVKWINTTYAMLTTANGANLNYVGGYEKKASSRIIVLNGLESSWDVTDRASADETLAWILDEGHRKSFAEEMNTMKENGYLDMTPEEVSAQLSESLTPEQTACCLAMLEAYRTYGESAIDAWDYCRALQLLGWYYVADLYTEQEAMDKSLEIAAKLQTMYTSWDELCESYLRGYNYWSEDDPLASDSATAARRAIFDKLKAADNSPYQLDWNTPLTKTW